jgi:ferredoxin
MHRRRHADGPQRRRGGDPGATSDLQRWWSRASVPGPTAAPSIAVVRADLCIGCGECASACPVSAIPPISDARAAVNESLCSGCGACVAVCPVGAVEMSARPRLHRS